MFLSTFLNTIFLSPLFIMLSIGTKSAVLVSVIITSKVIFQGKFISFKDFILIFIVLLSKSELGNI